MIKVGGVTVFAHLIRRDLQMNGQVIRRKDRFKVGCWCRRCGADRAWNRRLHKERHHQHDQQAQEGFAPQLSLEHSILVTRPRCTNRLGPAHQSVIAQC